MEKLSNNSILSKILWAAEESGIFDPRKIAKKTGYERRYIGRVLSKYSKNK